MLREDGVLERAEERGLHTQEKEDGEEHGLVAQDHGDGAEGHDADLEQLHAAHEAGLLALVGDLAGGRAEEEVRQDEDAAGDLDQRVRGFAREPGAEQDDERVLVDVVVERSEELRPEKGGEALLGEEARLAHGIVRPRRASPGYPRDPSSTTMISSSSTLA